jgi:hypothetical protein
MMSTPASSQARGHAPPAPTPSNGRRSFTLPARTVKRPASVPASTNSADGIETLFICSDSKIFSFTATGPAGDTSHPTPWKTPTERTLAVGMSSHVPPVDGRTNALQVCCAYTV